MSRRQTKGVRRRPLTRYLKLALKWRLKAGRHMKLASKALNRAREFETKERAKNLAELGPIEEVMFLPGIDQRAVKMLLEKRGRHGK